MHASAEVLEGNKVKLSVEVDEEELARAEEVTFRRLSREARLPGFRPGKVPRRVLQARLGPLAIREEVLRDALPRYYAEAVEETELDVIAAPEIDVTAGSDGGPLAFDAVVEVRPEVAIVGYEGLQVTLDALEPSEEEIDGQVDRLREQFATLTAVDRPARSGDLVTCDIHGTRDGAPAEGLSADDLVYEVGTGGIVDGFDGMVEGVSAGESFEMDAEDAPGGPARLAVSLKQVREKVLPAADDAFASDASEFETLAELRADLAQRLAAMRKLNANYELRERAAEALVELVELDPPAVLVNEELQRLLDDFGHRLAHQELSLEAYLAGTGTSAEQLLEELRTQAERQVKADLGLRALARAEAIEVDESDLDEEIVRLAAQARQAPAQLRETLERNERLEELRSQIRISKAMAWLIEHVAIVDSEGKPVDRAALRIEASELPEDVEQLEDLTGLAGEEV